MIDLSVWMAAVLLMACGGNKQGVGENDSHEFVIENGKLGPVELNMAIDGLPEQFDGLYDHYSYRKEEHENEMDGPWTDEYCLFTKDGKEIFRTDVDEDKVVSFRLLEGATFIKTADGFYVGYPARELFEQLPMTWETWFEGETFASKDHYTYFVSSDDLLNTDIPQKADDFKPDAKVCGIVCSIY